MPLEDFFKPKSKRGFMYNIKDNLIGYDDGRDTPGERLGMALNKIAKNPVQTILNAGKATTDELNYLMFQGGAELEPEKVLGYAAAPMAPGVLRGRVANVASAGGAKPKKGITAYHGSPHDFDRFSMDKIGTGEGGSLLGRGVNLSDNPKVADYYHEQLSGGRGTRYQVKINAEPEDFLDFNTMISEQGAKIKDSLSAAGLELGDISPEFKWNGYKGSVHLGGRRKFGEVSKNSSGYSARIGKSEIGNFQSPEAAGDALMREVASRGIRGRGETMTGFDAYTALGGRDGGSEALHSAGIKGTKMSGEYGVGKATDFVVFDENLIEIVRKYGVAGAAAMLGISAQELQAQVGGDQ